MSALVFLMTPVSLDVKLVQWFWLDRVFDHLLCLAAIAFLVDFTSILNDICTNADEKLLYHGGSCIFCKQAFHNANIIFPLLYHTAWTSPNLLGGKCSSRQNYCSGVALLVTSRLSLSRFNSPFANSPSPVFSFSFSTLFILCSFTSF